MRTMICGIALSAILALPTAGELAAQTVRGVVVNAATGDPVADASVVLLDSKGQIRRGTLTAPDGSFSLAIPENDTYTVRVGGAGYSTWDSQPMKLRTDEASELEVRLAPVGGETGWMEAFYQRRATGNGTFLTAQDIQERGGDRFTDIMQHLSGVSVVPLPGSRDYFTVRLAGSHAGAERAGVRHRGERSGDCPPQLYVDGKWWGTIDDAGDRGPDFELLPRDLAGVEIYTAAVVPDEFYTGRESLCGVIAVWRKPGS
ncbi:MAG: hypothetical protein GTN62_05900 [Gemmatimonadales bacterium]|nr:hypothetical protein [Gemmatimonadales bacterium]NIN11030.1 hypothetical protein [Gemmatimonadales bacterium]NIN49627.1 hypothetical protein [Gemmatimonadales bacterium]NIP07091.1 hypothetical protein [Gemmatimonadales bacterium]NIQ99482.1 hypothetical protein [Gemmatimonadales bacterium]